MCVDNLIVFIEWPSTNTCVLRLWQAIEMLQTETGTVE